MYAGAGIILLTPDFRILLVQDAKSKKWGFSKGHREPEETSEIATAQRELLEETGIPSSAYTIYEHPFRIIRGSSSYVFYYAIMNTLEYAGRIQCRGEISGLVWVSLLQFFLTPAAFDGNKYLRTWIADITTHADRKTNTILQGLIGRVFGTLQSQDSQQAAPSSPVSSGSL
jgi:8-oxo-dGTP pyrophosphatase MutT (NUDIX family)